MPSTPPTPTPAAARAGHPRIALAIAAIGLVVIGLVGWLAQKHWYENTVQGVAASIVASQGKGLPKDYGNGLVLERVTVEGRDIVMLMRSTRLSLEQAAKDPASYAQAKAGEQQALQQFCGNDDVDLVLAHGMSIKRRFVDLQGALFFEVSLSARDCPRMP